MFPTGRALMKKDEKKKFPTPGRVNDDRESKTFLPIDVK